MVLLHLHFRDKTDQTLHSFHFGSWSNFRLHEWTLVCHRNPSVVIVLSEEIPLQPIVSLSLSLAAFTDLSIAVVFSVCLLRGRNQYSQYVMRGSLLLPVNPSNPYF